MLKKNFIVSIIGLVILLEYMDVGIINTSLPQIAFSLHINPINLKVALTIYLLAFGVFIPAVGWVADRFGAKKILLIAIAGFLLSSIACGLSTSLFMLTCARFLQGMFAAFSSPVVRIILVKLFPNDRAKLSARLTSIFLLGHLLGPLLGGAITTWFNWRFIFFINVPVGIFTIVAIYFFLPKIESSVQNKFDYIGFMLLSSVIVFLLLFVETITVPRVDSLLRYLFIAIAFISALLYYFYNRYKIQHILDFSVFRNKGFRSLSVILVAVRMLGMNMSFLIPIFVQTHLQYSALHTGLLMLPMMIGAISYSNLFKHMSNSVKLKQQLYVGFGSKILAQLSISYCFFHFNIYLLLIALFVSGFTSSIIMSSINAHLYNDLKQQQISAAAVIQSSVIQLCRGFAIAGIAMLLILTSGKNFLFAHTIISSNSYAIVLWLTASLLLMTVLYLKKALPNID